MYREVKRNFNQISLDSPKKLHQCPDCSCYAHPSRPISPVVLRPQSPVSPRVKPSIYLKRNVNLDSSFGSNTSSPLMPGSPRIVRSPSNPSNIQVNIRYMSPSKNLNSPKSPQIISRPIQRVHSPKIFNQYSPNITFQNGFIENLSPPKE